MSTGACLWLAINIIFRERKALEPLCERLVRTAIHAVQLDHVATFLGRHLTGNFSAELGNALNTRIQGTRIRHHMGPASIKMHDKFGRVLGTETTTNDVSFFKHHRTVEHRDGSNTFKLAPLKKAIYSLGDHRQLLAAAIRRYLEFISTIEDPTVRTKILDKLSKPQQDAGRMCKGFNFFNSADRAGLLEFRSFGHSGAETRAEILQRVHDARQPHGLSELAKALPRSSPSPFLLANSARCRSDLHHVHGVGAEGICRESTPH